MVGEITDIYDTNPKYKVIFKSVSWYYNEEDLEKVVEDLRELIKPCYAVKFRDGRYAIAFARKDNGINFNKIEDISSRVTKLSDFDKSLIDKDGYSQYDIMEIRGYAENNQEIIAIRDVVWEREEKSPTQIKLEELEKEQRKIADEIAELRKEL